MAKARPDLLTKSGTRPPVSPAAPAPVRSSHTKAPGTIQPPPERLRPQPGRLATTSPKPAPTPKPSAPSRRAQRHATKLGNAKKRAAIHAAGNGAAVRPPVSPAALAPRPTLLSLVRSDGELSRWQDRIGAKASHIARAEGRRKIRPADLREARRAVYARDNSRRDRSAALDRRRNAQRATAAGRNGR